MLVIMIVIVTEDDHPSVAVIFSLPIAIKILNQFTRADRLVVETATSAVPPMSSRTQPGSAKRIWRQIGDSGTAAEISPHEAVVGENKQKKENHQIIANVAIFSRLLTMIPCCFLRTGNHVATRGPEISISKPQERNVSWLHSHRKLKPLSEELWGSRQLFGARIAAS